MTGFNRHPENINRKGRKPGSLNKRTVVKSALDEYSEVHGINAETAIVSSLIGLAIAGDVAASRVILERIEPALKPRDEPIKIQNFKGSLTEKAGIVVGALVNSKIRPSEAYMAIQILNSQARIIEIDELEKRVSQLEKGVVQ